MYEYLPTKEKLERKFVYFKNDLANSNNNKKNIFVLGGSQGSEIINNLKFNLFQNYLKSIILFIK